MCIEGNGNPIQCSCLENPKDRGAWWAAVYGVAQSQIRLKRLSSSSSSSSSIPKLIYTFNLLQSESFCKGLCFAFCICFCLYFNLDEDGSHVGNKMRQSHQDSDKEE